MFNYYLTCLKKYANFSDRATRSEFWYFVLVNFVISFVLSVVGLPTIALIYSIAVLVPSFAVYGRRLNDIKKSLWFMLLLLVPVVNLISVIVFGCTPSK